MHNRFSPSILFLFPPGMSGFSDGRESMQNGESLSATLRSPPFSSPLSPSLHLLTELRVWRRWYWLGAVIAWFRFLVYELNSKCAISHTFSPVRGADITMDFRSVATLFAKGTQNSNEHQIVVFPVVLNSKIFWEIKKRVRISLCIDYHSFDSMFALVVRG